MHLGPCAPVARDYRARYLEAVEARGKALDTQFALLADFRSLQLKADIIVLAAEEVLRISDRKHDAWDALRNAIAAYRGEVTSSKPVDRCQCPTVGNYSMSTGAMTCSRCKKEI